MDPVVKVLLVEDQHLLREGIKLMLQAEPSLRVTGEAATAQEVLDQPELPYDILLLDLSLPDMDGLQLIRALRARGWQAPILVVTGHELPTIMRDSFAAGANGYVLKTSSPQELRQAVIEVARGGSYTSQGLRGQGEPAPRAEGPSLTGPERELLHLAGRRVAPEDIRAHLGVSEGTFNSMLRSVLRKLAASDLAQAVVEATRSGLIVPDPHGGKSPEK